MSTTLSDAGGLAVLTTHVTLWHGTVEQCANDIIGSGINLAKGRIGTDFGKGFYTTTKRQQAEKWAHFKSINCGRSAAAGCRPAVIMFNVPLDELAALQSRVFIRAGRDSHAYWEFVRFCRSAPPSHLRLRASRSAGWYDVVYGPVAATWVPELERSFADSDQISFHTDVSVRMMNRIVKSGEPNCRIDTLFG